MIVTIHLVVVILGNLSATFLVRRAGERRMVMISFWILAIGIGLTATATWLPMLFSAQLFTGMADGINYPVLTGLNILYVEESERNSSQGLYQSVYSTGIFTGAWLGGILAQAIGTLWMIFVTALATLALGLLGGSKMRKNSRNDMLAT